MKIKFTFTVFTATYNRANTLPRVFESLKSQTFRDFEWLVVDDGSTDGTKALIERWQQEAAFPIRYLRQENRGKHTAFNYGVREANGELFLSIDSDDSCVSNALERFKYHWDSIPSDQRGHFSAVTALCARPSGEIVGVKFPKDILDSDSLELFYKFKVSGDKWGFHRTQVLRDFPFPEEDGIRFVTENVVWFSIARKWKTRFVNEPLLVYYAQEWGEQNQLTKAKPSKHAKGRVISFQYELNESIDWIGFSPLVFVKCAANYSRYSFHIGLPMRVQAQGLNNRMAIMLWLFTLPLGCLLYVKDKLMIN